MRASNPCRLEIAKRLVYEPRIPSSNAAFHLLKYTWDYYGPSQETSILARRVIHRLTSRKHAAKLDELKLLRASILAESATFGEAFRIVTDVLENRDELWICQNSSMALITAMWHHGLLKSKAAETVAQAMAKVSSTVGRFEEMVSGPNSICVVGNSPKEIGKGNGRAIDDHDIVIRFNNFSTDFDYVADYGRKTNIWVKAGGYSDIWRRPSRKFDLIVFSGPDRRYHALRGGADLVDLVDEGGVADFIPARVYSDASISINHPPSAGILVLHWLRLLRGPLKDAGVSLFGFGFTDQANNESKQYFSNVSSKATYPHNWEAEERHFREFIL